MRCKPKTHFEQIPVEAVKKIANDYPKSKETKTDDFTVEHPLQKTEPYSVRTPSLRE